MIIIITPRRILNHILHTCLVYLRSLQWLHTRWSINVLILDLLLAKRIHSLIYLTIQILLRRRFKWHLACKHDEKKYTTGPYICRWSKVFFFVHYLRSHVGRCSAEHLKFVFRDASKSIVNDLYLVITGIIHDIFRFEISVTDVFRMSIL